MAVTGSLVVGLVVVGGSVPVGGSAVTGGIDVPGSSVVVGGWVVLKVHPPSPPPIQLSFRRNSIVASLGGSEFICFLPIMIISSLEHLSRLAL